MYSTSSSPLKIIIVGVGNRGSMVVEYFNNSSGWVVVALVDLSVSFLKQASIRFQIPQNNCYQDLSEALDKIECDAVFITSPTYTHYEHCQTAFSRKKHVLVEKPMTIGYDQACGLVDQAREVGVRFCVAQNFRFMPHCQALISHANNPQSPFYIGDIEIVEYTQQICRSNVRNANYPFSMVWEIASHHADLILAIFKEEQPSQIRGEVFSTSWSPYHNPSNIRSWIDYGDKCHIQHLLTFDSTINNLEVVLIGNLGALRMDNQRKVYFYPYGESFEVTLPTEIPVSHEASSNGFHEVVELWRNYIQYGEEPINSGRNNLNTLLFCQSLIQSVKLGEAIDSFRVL